MSQEAVLAHQFDSLGQQKEATSMGMWAFLVTEVMFFGGLLFAYGIYRYLYPEAFHELSTHMNTTLGAINTVFLLTSSFTVVLAVHFAQSGDRKKLLMSLGATLLFAFGFLVVKSIEYYGKYKHGMMIGFWDYQGPYPDKMHLFACLYFFMTGLHAIHVIIGIGLFKWLFWMAWTGRIHENRYMPVEVCGLYWHFVDLVWVYLFPLFYLVGAPA